MADAKLPYSVTLTGDVTLDLGGVNALSIDLTSVAGTHTFNYWHTGSQAWVLLKTYSTTTHETINNLNGKKIQYVTSSGTGTVVELSEVSNVRNS